MKYSTIYFMMAISFVLFGCNEQNTQETIPKITTEEVDDLPQESIVEEQTIYVPVYSSIYTREERVLIDLTATLSIRNTSLKYPIVISHVDYYDSNGKLVKNYIKKPFSLGILGTKDFVVKEWELAGGTGANFIVKWKSNNKVSSPVVQAVMISMKTGVGISFVCEGKEIKE